MQGIVTAVSRSPTHSIAKWNQNSITLVAGLGVDGDAHNGKTVKHLSRLLRFGNTPNRRQIHLIHAELHHELRIGGFSVVPGQMGENVTTRGVDLLGLPTGARLHLGGEAVIEVTGLRNPCGKLNKIQPGLMKATLGRDAEGNLIRKAGIMAIVLAGGAVRPGDDIEVELPKGPYLPLAPI
jgi:MOSC domain-containing protein YiiM